MTIQELQALLPHYEAQWGPTMTMKVEEYDPATQTLTLYDLQVATAPLPREPGKVPVALVFRAVGHLEGAE